MQISLVTITSNATELLCAIYHHHIITTSCNTCCTTTNTQDWFNFTNTPPAVCNLNKLLINY